MGRRSIPSPGRPNRISGQAPHRSGREGFHSSGSSVTERYSRLSAHNFATLQASGYCLACSAICRIFVDTVGERIVPSVVPFSRTLCPVSPSLQWVPRVAVPHLPDRCPRTDHRYYDPLRLPLYPSRVASLSLASRYLARFFAFVSRLYGSLTHRNGPVSARALVHPVPLIFRLLLQGDRWLSQVPKLPL